MQTIIGYIAGPIIGAVIGYITNYIAVKMLFRPLEPVMIGRFRMPLTPGVVPRRKDALADVLGQSIYKKFFNADDLELIFTSDSLSSAFGDGIADALIADDFGVERITKNSPGGEHITDALKEELCVRIAAGVLKADIAGILSTEGMEKLQKGKANAALSLVSSDVMASLSVQIASGIENYVLSEGRELIMAMLDEEIKLLSKYTVRDVMSTIGIDREWLAASATSAYAAFMHGHVRPIVETIDVGGMITDKVKEMDASEVEGLVLDVVRKELRYVVWLGAGLGALIGTVNIFI